MRDKIGSGQERFVHYTDKASPNLLNYCLTGKHIKNIQFVIRKAGGDPLEYLIIKFTDVIITHVGMQGSLEDEARPREQVRFSFTKMTQDYVMQNAEGQKAGVISATYERYRATIFRRYRAREAVVQALHCG